MSINTTDETYDQYDIDIGTGLLITFSIPIFFGIFYAFYKIIKVINNREKLNHYCYKKGECPICLEEYSSLVKYKCKHTFCKECSDSWKQVSLTCPLCRAEI